MADIASSKDELKDREMIAKKQQVMRTDSSFQNILLHSRQIASYLQKIGQSYDSIQLSIDEAYLKDTNDDSFTESAKRMITVFKNLSVMQNTLCQKMETASKYFANWNKGILAIQAHDKGLPKVKKQYDHYDSKLDKLRVTSKIKLQKGQQDTLKERERIFRNEKKFKDSKNFYQDHIKKSLQLVYGCYKERFNTINPCLEHLIVNLEEFYERSKNKLSNISEEPLFVDSENTKDVLHETKNKVQNVANATASSIKDKFGKSKEFVAGKISTVADEMGVDNVLSSKPTSKQTGEMESDVYYPVKTQKKEQKQQQNQIPDPYQNRQSSRTAVYQDDKHRYSQGYSQSQSTLEQEHEDLKKKLEMEQMKSQIRAYEQQLKNIKIQEESQLPQQQQQSQFNQSGYGGQSQLQSSNLQHMYSDENTAQPKQNTQNNQQAQFEQFQNFQEQNQQQGNQQSNEWLNWGSNSNGNQNIAEISTFNPPPKNQIDDYNTQQPAQSSLFPNQQQLNQPMSNKKEPELNIIQTNTVYMNDQLQNQNNEPDDLFADILNPQQNNNYNNNQQGGMGIGGMGMQQQQQQQQNTYNQNQGYGYNNNNNQNQYTPQRKSHQQNDDNLFY